MDDSSVSDPPPTADEIAHVLPDLARCFLANGRLENSTCFCNVERIRRDLLSQGHLISAVDAALNGECQRTSSDSDDVSIAGDKLTSWSSIALALSGGGLRATLFELGITLYLAITGELKNVKAVVSVSGGSILAAHLATRWDRATSNTDDFVQTAADLVRFLRTDIRNLSMVRWLWSRCLVVPFFLRKWGRVHFLEHQYKRHFVETTLGDLPSDSGTPLFAFVASDTKRQHRVALMREGIFRFGFDGVQADTTVLAEGVHLSLAVASSSCFPPVFENLELRYKDLGITYDEFDGQLNLRDGGVAGNLGVEVLTGLVNQGSVVATRLFFCDAENGLPEEPSTGPLATVYTGLAALSESARQVVKSLGSNAQLLRFASRPSKDGLAFRALTSLASYRTDLDRPTWQECQALMIHGAAICADALNIPNGASRPSPDRVRDTIREVLKRAGCEDALPEPTEKDFKRCSKRSYWRIAVHALLILLCICAAAEVAAFITPQWSIRPLTQAWRLIIPEKVIDADVDQALNKIANTVCNDSSGTVTADLKRGILYRLMITPASSPSRTLIHYRKSVRPNGCQRDVDCECTFRGQFSTDEFEEGRAVNVVGRFLKVTTRGTMNVYLDFYDCYAEPLRAE